MPQWMAVFLMVYCIVSEYLDRKKEKLQRQLIDKLLAERKGE
jgi:hypothetical protein